MSLLTFLMVVLVAALIATIAALAVLAGAVAWIELKGEQTPEAAE